MNAFESVRPRADTSAEPKGIKRKTINQPPHLGKGEAKIHDPEKARQNAIERMAIHAVVFSTQQRSRKRGAPKLRD